MGLTRKEMEAIIDRKESVIYDGRVVARQEDLPTEADLAKGSVEKTPLALESIDAQIKALEAQRASLIDSVATPPAKPPEGGQAGEPAGTPDGGGTEPDPLEKNIADLTEYLSGVGDEAELEALYQREAQGQNRKGALAAIEERLAQVEKS